MPLFSDHITNMYYSGAPSYSALPSYSSYGVPAGLSYSASYLNPGGNYSKHSSLGSYSRPALTSRWTPGVGRNYSPILSTITERGTSCPVRIRSPRKLPLSQRSYASSYISRPININTADIDVSRDRYRPKATPAPAPIEMETKTVATDDSPFMPRIDGKPETGIDSSPGPQRSTIKRGRTVVRLHTIRRKEKDSPKTAVVKPNVESTELDQQPPIETNKFDLDTNSGSWREKLSEDLVYKDKREKKTLGAKMIEKFIVKHNSDEDDANNSLKRRKAKEEEEKQKLLLLEAAPAPKVTNKSPDRRCSMEMLVEQASILDSLIKGENLSTATLDLSSIGTNDKIADSVDTKTNLIFPAKRNSLQSTKSDHSLHDRLNSLKDAKDKQCNKKKSLKKSASGGSIRRLDSITEVPKEVPQNHSLPVIDESSQLKEVKSKPKPRVKQKITSVVEVTEQPKPFKIRVDHVEVEEKPTLVKKDIIYSSTIEDSLQTATSSDIGSRESKSRISTRRKTKKPELPPPSPEPEDGNFWDKIGKRETVYLNKRKQYIAENIDRNRRAAFWYPEDETTEMEQNASKTDLVQKTVEDEMEIYNTNANDNKTAFIHTVEKPTDNVSIPDMQLQQYSEISETFKPFSLPSVETSDTAINNVQSSVCSAGSHKNEGEIKIKATDSSVNKISLLASSKSISSSEKIIDTNHKLEKSMENTKVENELHNNGTIVTAPVLGNIEAANTKCDSLEPSPKKNDQKETSQLKITNLSPALKQTSINMTSILENKQGVVVNEIKNEIHRAVVSVTEKLVENTPKSLVETCQCKCQCQEKDASVKIEIKRSPEASVSRPKDSQSGEISGSSEISQKNIPNDNNEVANSPTANEPEEVKSETNIITDDKIRKKKKTRDYGLKVPVSPNKPSKDEAAVRPLIATPRPLQKKTPQVIHSSSSSESSSEDSSSDDDADESDSSESSGEFFECETHPDGRTSTGSNDSGFDSSAPTSPAGFLHIKKDCDVNCHRKCEKLTANLCGVNQRLLVEALASRNDSKRGGDASSSTAPAQGGVAADLIEQEIEASTAYELYRKTGRFTPPAKTIPRFRKYNIEDFHFIKVLGKGSFGKVLLAELRDTEYYYAVKCLKKDVVLEDDDVECTLIERKVLALGTNHPYLCHLFATFQTDSHLFFVMEYLNGGDLMFHIQQSGRFPETRARFYAAEIVSGLKFLHKRGIVYRDLKLDNILLDYEGHVRIADFGMCKLQIFLDKTADTFCGTPDYMAPEIIKGQKYNQTVDWWSFGVLLYEMLIGQSPFSGCDEDELFWSICNETPNYPRFLSQQAHSILTRLLDKDARTRLGGMECMHGDIREQDFFSYIHWDKLDRRDLDAPFKPKVRHPLDTQYFDRAFTGERPRLTAVEAQVIRTMDQAPFRGFSYTNPNATDR